MSVKFRPKTSQYASCSSVPRHDIPMPLLLVCPCGHFNAQTVLSVGKERNVPSLFYERSTCLEVVAKRNASADI